MSLSEGTDNVEDISFEIFEDATLGDDMRQVWIKAIHPDKDRFDLGSPGEVGFVYAVRLNPEEPVVSLYHDNPKWDQLLPQAWKDFDKLHKQIGGKNIELWGIQGSGSSRKFRGEGLGQAMYVRLLKYIANKYRGICVPNSAWKGSGGTSLLECRNYLLGWKH